MRHPTMKHLNCAALLVLLPVFPGCDDEMKWEGVDWAAATVAGGFDDFDSAGAALGFSVDAANGMILIAALKFDLPFYRGSFRPSGDAVESAEKYHWGIVPSSLLDEVAQYPLLAAGLTDTAGIRTALNGDLVAIILQGDLNAAEPANIHVATHGSLQLTREDGPTDLLEGRLYFVKVVKTGDSWERVYDAEPLKFESIHFEWSTLPAQPP
jgi:hypothetical protein